MLKKKTIKTPFQDSVQPNPPRGCSTLTPIENSPTEYPSARNSLFSNTYLEQVRNDNIWDEAPLDWKSNSLSNSKKGERKQKNPRQSICSISNKSHEKLLRKIIHLENELALSRQIATSLASSLRESERVNQQLRQKYNKDSADHFRQNFIAKINDMSHLQDPSLSTSFNKSYFTICGKSFGHKSGVPKKSVGQNVKEQRGTGAPLLMESQKQKQLKKEIGGSWEIGGSMMLKKQNNILRESFSKNHKGVSK